ERPPGFWPERPGDGDRPERQAALHDRHSRRHRHLGPRREAGQRAVPGGPVFVEQGHRTGQGRQDPLASDGHLPVLGEPAPQWEYFGIGNERPPGRGIQPRRQGGVESENQGAAVPGAAVLRARFKNGDRTLDLRGPVPVFESGSRPREFFHFLSALDPLSSIISPRREPAWRSHPMHVDPLPNSAAKAANGSENDRLTGYHYFVFLIAALGWLFDTMDQQLFLLARNPAIRDLLNAGP